MEKNKNNAGFTLVEIIVAITILALTGGTILSSFTMAFKLNARAKHEYEACSEAQVALEKVLTSGELKQYVGLAVQDMINNAEEENPSLSQIIGDEGVKDISEWEITYTETDGSETNEISGKVADLLLNKVVYIDEETNDGSGTESDADVTKNNVSIGVRLSKDDDAEYPNVLCTVTVTVKDDSNELSQLTGKRNINLAGSIGGS